MPERHLRLLVTAAFVLAASPALAQSCGGTNAVSPAGGTLVATGSEGMSCITLYDAAVTQEGRVQAAYDQGAIAGLTTNGYDAVGDLVTSTGIGGTTRYSYNAVDGLTEVTDPLGHTTTYTYDPAGNLATVTGPTGPTEDYHYDAQDRLISSTGPLDITATMYDPDGNMTLLTEAGPQTFQYGYDADGRMTMVTDPLGNVTTTTYDTLGNDIQTTDFLGNTTTYLYDPDGPMLVDITPNLTSTAYVYDPDGELLNTSDLTGNTDLWYVHDVPEPASAVLLAPALGLLWRRRRRAG